MMARRLLLIRGLRGPPVAAMVALAAAVACLALLASPATGTSYTPIASWDFNEGSGTTAADQSGYGHTATLKGGATWGPGASGLAGDYSLRLNGTNAYASIPDSAPLNLLGVSFHLEAAVYLEAYNSGNVSAVMSKRSTQVGNPGWLFSIGGLALNADQEKKVRVTINGGSKTVAAYGTVDIPLNTWTSIAADFDDATGNITFWIDGVQDTTCYLAPSITSGQGTELDMGRDTATGQYFFKGRLDNLAIGVIPEPVTMAGLALGIGSLATYLRKRK